MKIYATILVAALSLMTMACTGNKTNQEPAQRSAIVCYSQTGVTAKVAQELHHRLGAPVEMLQLEEPYDGTYDETIQRSLAEREAGLSPALKPLNINLADYDTIYLGYPIWFGTYALPIVTLLKDNDLSGKVIVPFTTFGSGGLEASVVDLKAAQPGAEVLEGYGVREVRIADMPAELERFLIESGLVEGTIEPLPEFGEEHAVSAEEVAVFDEACGDYPFPMGTPKQVAIRNIGRDTEYRFATDERVVYVLVKPDTKAVFTRVVR